MITDGERLALIAGLVDRVAASMPDTSGAFLGDRMLADATAYRLLHIGEQCIRLGLTVKVRHPHIPWRSIAAMRHLLAHDYQGVDRALLWNVVTNHLAPLAAVCQAETKA